MTIPTPTAALHTWFPVTVEKPDGTLIRRARVYVTPEGLYVYTRKPADGVTPNHWWPLNWAATAQPKRTQASSMNGHQFKTTEGGTVTVHTNGEGCGCSNPLKKWAPEYAGTTLNEWPTGGES
jgi:hypothetical protein